MGYPIKLDTNGSRPQVIKRLIDEQLVDYIAMDIKTDPCRYSPSIVENSNPDHIISSIQIIMESPLAYEFRTTCVKPIVDSHDVKKIAKIIKGATLYALQHFHNSRVLHPDFFREIKPDYSEDELMRLKAIAEPLVKKCIVR
jgi:pyruvate formate lyase activating enzyme